jgi:hypothetical protein
MTRYDASGECTIDITDNIYFNPIMVFDGIPYLGYGSGDRQIAMAFQADQDILLSSPIFYPESGGVPAHIKFCSQLRLYGHNGTLVNWPDIAYVQNMDVGGSTGFRRLTENAQDAETALANQEDRSRRHLLECFDNYTSVFDIFEWYPEIEAPTTSPAPTGVNDTLPPTDNDTLPPTEQDTGTSAPTGGYFDVLPDAPLEVVRDKGHENATDSYQAGIYLCNEDLLASNSTLFIRRQGAETVRICVERNALCIQDGIHLRDIVAFSFFRDSLVQVAIEPVGQEPSHGLTELHCEPG